MKKRIEYEFTADDVADWVKARIDGHVSLQGLFDTLKNLSKILAAPTGGIIAFCEARERKEKIEEKLDIVLAHDARRAHLDELDDAPEKPELSRFLPRRPYDVPTPPDGWVYVGGGSENNSIRWTASTDIWHRFGLLSPSEGGGWIQHTPGDVMPVETKTLVDVLLGGAEIETFTGMNLDWGERGLGTSIIGWRPALAEVRS